MELKIDGTTTVGLIHDTIAMLDGLHLCLNYLTNATNIFFKYLTPLFFLIIIH